MTAYAITRSFLDRGQGRTDIVADMVAAATAMEFRNNGNVICLINNGSGGSVTATLKAVPDPYGRGGATIADEVIVIPTLKIGFFPFMHPAMFNNGGVTQITLSASATVTVGFFELLKAR